ncbi:MAG: biotin--[acetyl-CoA-carboxylase] ligase [Bacteroidales bacterium]|nr:biotin--[acetyl-CoA-carboxylase] ligase [Bacteroidales bacterium]
MEFSIHHFDSLKSTNEVAVKLITEGTAVEGTIISTTKQTQGKGQSNNSWESEKGKNLTLSLILEPAFLEPSRQFFLTQFISLALVDTVKKYLPKSPIRIKWPNDLYCGDKKMAGVLIQNFLKGNSIEFSVIGIGLNVNQTKFLSDAPNPVSMADITTNEFDLEIIQTDLLNAVNYYYEEIKNEKGRTNVLTLYMNHLYRYQITSTYQDEQGIFTGRIKEVNSYGQLIIEDLTGKNRIYNFKEISFLTD